MIETFDATRLFAHPAYGALAAAAVSAVAEGSVEPLGRALGDAAREDLVTEAAFAVSVQGLSALIARLPDTGRLPGSLVEFLRDEAARVSARSLVLRSKLVEIVRLLRSDGIEVVALKGAAFAFRDYPDPALRPMGDLDLLLREPSDMGRATALLETRTRYRTLFDTSRHRVFAEEGERVVRPLGEDPGNPIRLELHHSFRVPVLGRVYDLTGHLLSETTSFMLDGTPLFVPSGDTRVALILVHAAEDFAGRGIRGIQAYDFQLLASLEGPLFPRLPWVDGARAAPLLFAADTVERLFPGCFDPSFLAQLSRYVPASLRRRAADLPGLRFTRGRKAWTLTALGLIEGPVPRARFLLRTIFPLPGEVRANVAPTAAGRTLGIVYARVLLNRIRTLVGRCRMPCGDSFVRKTRSLFSAHIPRGRK